MDFRCPSRRPSCAAMTATPTRPTLIGFVAQSATRHERQHSNHYKLPTTACALPHRSAQQARPTRCRLKPSRLSARKGSAQLYLRRRRAGVRRRGRCIQVSRRSARSELHSPPDKRHQSRQHAPRCNGFTLNEPPVPLDESLNPPPARRVVVNRRVAPGVLSDESDGDKPTSSGFVVTVAPSP